jgi:hypothetical protein
MKLQRIVKTRACTESGITEEAGAPVALQICILEVSGLNLIRNISYPDWGVCGFPQSLQENTGTQHQLVHKLFLFRYILIHYSSINL